MIPTGFIVAIVIYVLAMVWVPVSIHAGDHKVWGSKGESFTVRYVMPVFFMLFWPITLVYAIWSQVRD